MTLRIPIAVALAALAAGAAPAQQTPSPPTTTPPTTTPPETTTPPTTTAPPATTTPPETTAPPETTTPTAPTRPTTPPAAEGGRPYSVSLTGAAERPNPGDPDGTGTAALRVNPGQGQVCYNITVANIDAATLAHIHRGGADVAGPVVVNFDPPADGSSEGCASVDRALAQELIRTPAGFYVNVHNAAFPNGAVRGQLSR